MKIAFIDTSTRLETIHDLAGRARGGMVSSLFLLSDRLSLAGHDVHVLSDIAHSGVTHAGVRWIPWDGEPVLSQQDFLVYNRTTGDGYPQLSARRRILWTHDLPHNGFIPDPRTMHAFTATVFMSRYAERVWRTFYRTIGRSFLIPNGVDRELFHPREKDLEYLIYASAPNRGLRRLPLIFDAIRTRLGTSLRMKAFSNMEKQHPNECNGNGDAWDESYKAIEESSVELCDPVPQKDLAEELGRAGMMILPTDYPEICSNIILQSLASGTPVVTTGGLGSAGEWVSSGRNGYLTTFLPLDYMVYHLELVRGALGILGDRFEHRMHMDRAARTKILTWDEVARRWETMLKKLS